MASSTIIQYPSKVPYRIVKHQELTTLTNYCHKNHKQKRDYVLRGWRNG